VPPVALAKGGCSKSSEIVLFAAPKIKEE